MHRIATFLIAALAVGFIADSASAQIGRGRLLKKLRDDLFGSPIDQAQQQQAAANTEAAKARAKLAQQQLERARALQQKRSVSEELLAQREAEATAAKAETKARSAAQSITRNQVRRCKIKAPYNAIVVARSGQVGELASTGTALSLIHI